MKSIRARLIGGYVLVVTLTVLVVLAVGGWLLDRNIVRGIDMLNAAEFQEIHDRVKAAVTAGAEADLIQIVREHAELDEPLYCFQIRKIGGRVLFRSPNMGKEIFLPNALTAPHETVSIAHLGTMRVSQFTEGLYEVQIGSSMGNRRQLFHAYTHVALVLLAIAFFMSLSLGYSLSRYVLAPIRRIERTASRITADNLNERIPVGPAEDELAGLARLLNQMLERLEYSFGRLWRFAADASHELKTPLSLIRLQSEKLLLHSNLTPGQQEALQQQMESVDRLNSVIEKLLFISKSEFGAVRLNLREQSTTELIDAFAEDAEVLCEDAKVCFVTRENAGIAATFDAVLLRQVLLNLLNNALHVLDPGGKILLSSAKQHNAWVVSLEDSGPGLPEEKLEEIFEPFVRMEKGEQHRSGAGLGLAICRSIIELHHGKIHAENRKGTQGLRVVFQIPIS